MKKGAYGGTKVYPGAQFGRLRLLEILSPKKALAVCECGTTTEVWRSNLTNGFTKSCGKGTCHSKYVEGDAALRQLERTYRYQANLRGYEFRLTNKEFRTLVTGECHYCGAAPHQRLVVNGVDTPLMYNGIDRKLNDAGYHSDNCVTACKDCNVAKMDRNYEEFIDWVRRAARHLKL